VIGLLTTGDNPRFIKQDDLWDIHKSEGGRLFRTMGERGTYITSQNGDEYVYSIFKITPANDFNSNDIFSLLSNNKGINVTSIITWYSTGKKLSVDNFNESPGLSQVISVMKISA
jgi:hypothetical protein